MSKNRHYHVIRITYSDDHVSQRSFANKHIALRWLAYRRAIANGESVIYAGTMLHLSIKHNKNRDCSPRKGSTCGANTRSKLLPDRLRTSLRRTSCAHLLRHGACGRAPRIGNASVAKSTESSGSSLIAAAKPISIGNLQNLTRTNTKVRAFRMLF